MNDLDAVKSELMQTVNNAILSNEAWLCDPLGHSPYQMTHFIIEKDNPTKDTQYRQIIRELWARWGAYRTAQYELETIAAKIVERNGWRDLLSLRCVRGIASIRRGKMMLADAEIKMQLDRAKEIHLDLDHRILRETDHFMGMLKGMEKPVEDRAKAEQENWQARAFQNPKVRELVSANGGTS